MFLLLFLIPLVLGFDAQDCRTNNHEPWMCDYMHEQNRDYAHKTEFFLRKSKVAESRRTIDELGANVFGLTSMSDRFRLQTNVALQLSHHKGVSRKDDRRHVKLTSSSAGPVDWRSNGYVSPVMDQGDCGDCFAFASAVVLEYWLARETGRLTPLSPQSLMDCTSGWGRPDVGCDGGLMEYVFEYAKNHPVITLSDAPYLERQTHCPGRPMHTRLRVNDYRVLMREDDPHAEDQIPALLHKYGPVAVGIDSSSLAMENYNDGVFQASYCTADIDHAVTIVGYTDDAWIIKNSWGPDWGRDNGYLYLERGKNACGVAEYIVYVTDATPINSLLSTDWFYDI